MFHHEDSGARLRRIFAIDFHSAGPVAEPAGDLPDPSPDLPLRRLKDGHKLILGPAKDHIVGPDRGREPVS